MKAAYVLSTTMEYAMRATLYVASRSPAAVRLPEIAKETHAPARYLAKILAQLARGGVLRSMRGPGGGFRLASRDRRISLSSIFAVFEPPTPRRCLLGHGLCGHNPDCPVHEKWAPIAELSADFFARTTIADLVPPQTFQR